MTTTTLTVGTKIRYTGDMANDEGQGEISAVSPCDFYGIKYDVTLDDGRTMNGLVSSSFGPLNHSSCADRFQVLA